MTNTPPNVVAKAHTMGYMLSHATSSMLYRAKDGALLVSWQQNDVSGVVFSVKGRWYRFQVVDQAP